MKNDLEKVKEYCSKWGVQIVNTEYTIMGFNNSAPEHKAYVSIKDKIIYWNNEHNNYSWNAALGLLHELSHVLSEIEPDEINEIDSIMLSFEYYSVKYLKLKNWARWASGIGLGYTYSYKDWSEASTIIRSQAVKTSLKEAVKKNILTAQGKPTFMEKS